LYSIRAAQGSRLLQDFLVSTDDSEIAEFSRTAGANVPFLRPPELATDNISIWPAVLHATEFWEDANQVKVDSVVLLQATSPLRTSEDIDGCIRHFLETQADICLTVVEAHDSPYFNMVEEVPDSPGLVRPCSEVLLRQTRRQDARRVLVVNGAVYVARRETFPIENQFGVSRLAAYEMPRPHSIDIDTAEDLEFAEWMLSREPR
jgi:CMP-N-acetylneuraminic acid synthetase